MQNDLSLEKTLFYKKTFLFQHLSAVFKNRIRMAFHWLRTLCPAGPVHHSNPPYLKYLWFPTEISTIIHTWLYFHPRHSKVFGLPSNNCPENSISKNLVGCLRKLTQSTAAPTLRLYICGFSFSSGWKKLKKLYVWNCWCFLIILVNISYKETNRTCISLWST